MKWFLPAKWFQPTKWFLLANLLWLISSSFSYAEDWPRWRGPRDDNSWNGAKLPDKWPGGGPKRVWSQPIGGGYAGIIVAEGTVYTMDRRPLKPGDPQGNFDGMERILGFDEATGKPSLVHEYPVKYGKLGGYANGPRACPTFHQGRLYTLGAVGHLHCLDTKTQKVLWSKDTVQELKARVPEWGFAAAPVVAEEQLIVHVGAQPNGCVLALNRDNGKEIWRSLKDPAGYATPILIEHQKQKQWIVWTPEKIHAIDAKDGKPLWSVPYPITYGVSIATPIFREGIVFITGYWDGAKAIRLGDKPEDGKLVWEDTRNLRGLMAPPLYKDGYLYSLDKGNGLTCAELKTGKKLWDDDNTLTPRGRNPQVSWAWIGNSDRILALNSVGDLVVAKIDPKGYEEISRVKVAKEQIWSHPAYTERHLFFRTDGGEQMGKGPFELTCLELIPASK